MPKDNYCRSTYSGNRCEEADGHEGKHSYFIEGWGDLTWTDEQAAAEHQKVVDYWAEHGVVWPPEEMPASEEEMLWDSLEPEPLTNDLRRRLLAAASRGSARALVERFEDLVVQRIAAGGVHVKGFATAKADLIRAVERGCSSE